MSQLPSTDVHNLDDVNWVANFSLPPREAVRNAYAQFAKKDFETWNYAKYDDLVLEGKTTVSCGHFVAWKERKDESVTAST